MIGLKWVLATLLLSAATLLVNPVFAITPAAEGHSHAFTPLLAVAGEAPAVEEGSDKTKPKEAETDSRHSKPLQPDLNPRFPHLLWILLIVIPIIILLLKAKRKKDDSDS